MRRAPAALGERRFDLAVVGAGITGACLAHDATARGLSVALIDKGDFGAATSAASSKLLHGGIRYLQQLAFGKVRESAFERIYFHNLAPHLIDWVPFIVPTYRGLAKGRLLLAGGMVTYGLLTLGERAALIDDARCPPGGRWLRRAEIERLVPGIDSSRMTGGRLFYESHMRSSERMTLAFVDAAASGGAVVANYVEAVALAQEGGQVQGLEVRDRLGGDSLRLSARAVINAAGPWIQGLNQRLAGAAGALVSGLSRGSHIVTRSLTNGHAVALPTRRRSNSVVSRGGRHVFVIPWRGHSLIGTTYVPFDGDLDRVEPTDDEIAELIAEVNGALGAGTLVRDDVVHAYAGLYPLQADEIDPDTYQGSGDYQIVDHASGDGIAGLFTVLGAKYTTARRLAERALDRVAPTLGNNAACSTRTEPLRVGAIDDLGGLVAGCHSAGVAGDAAAHLVRTYGADAPGLVERVRERPELGQPVAEGREMLAVEALWAAEREMAMQLEDLVMRRTGLGTLGHPGSEALERCADLMAEVIGWDQEERRRQCAFVARGLAS